jgi:Domain of unknown function (DUF1854).
MSSGSVRLHLAADIHQHESPSGESDRVAFPDARAESTVRKGKETEVGELRRENGRLVYVAAPGKTPEAARIVWARPLSERDGSGPVSIMMAGKKRELSYLPSLSSLSPESRRIAEEELAAGMIMPRILSVSRVKPRFGNYYFDVETDKGSRRFLLSSPENNSFRPKPDVIIVKDVSGNCYEINPVSGLDAGSLAELDRVL